MALGLAIQDAADAELVEKIDSGEKVSWQLARKASTYTLRAEHDRLDANWADIAETTQMHNDYRRLDNLRTSFRVISSELRRRNRK